MWDDAKALGRLTRWLLILMVFFLIGSGIAWVYNSKYFPVKQISIQGKLKYTDHGELQAIAQRHIRGNVFNADIDSAKEAFQMLPWIDSAMLSRQPIDKIEVNLVERIPVARWKSGGLVDSKGNVFKADADIDLPLFDGQYGTSKDMLRHYEEFTEILSSRNLQIKELLYTPRSAWLVVLDNGITVRLGRENEFKRLRQFVEIWPVLLKKRQSRISYVDMRYKDGFSVRYKQQEESAERAKP